MRSKQGLAFILFLVFSFGIEAAFVLLDTSGRSDALGGCGVAGIGSNLENPANVFENEGCSLTFFYTDLYNLDLPMGVLEIQGRVLGAPLALTINKLEDGDRPYQESAYTVTTGGKIGKVATGASVRRVLLESEVDGEGWAFDLGSTIDLRPCFVMGITANNLLGVINYSSGRVESQELSLDLGFAYNVDDILYTAEIRNFEEVGLGLEKAFGNDLSLRMGYAEKQLTAGLGIRKGIFNFDYAYVPHALGNVHRLYVKIEL